MKLDVGCGADSHGEVNLDLFKENSPHNRGLPVDLVKAVNFVVGDINHLPFKAGVFSETCCYQVLEHEGVNPKQALSELIRVTSGHVDITVPHYTLVFLQKYFFPQHCHTNILTNHFFHKQLKCYVHTVKAIKWRFLPSRWGRLPVYAPNDMHVTVETVAV